MSLLVGDEARVNRFFNEEATIKDSGDFKKFIDIIKVLDPLFFVLSDDYEDHHRI